LRILETETAFLQRRGGSRQRFIGLWAIEWV
jgi:hypothetical protein